jgi:hypothetical protein
MLEIKANKVAVFPRSGRNRVCAELRVITQRRIKGLTGDSSCPVDA